MKIDFFKIVRKALIAYQQAVWPFFKNQCMQLITDAGSENRISWKSLPTQGARNKAHTVQH